VAPEITQVVENKVVGDTGFEPATSTVCKRHKKTKRAKNKEFPHYPVMFYFYTTIIDCVILFDERIGSRATVQAMIDAIKIMDTIRYFAVNWMGL